MEDRPISRPNSNISASESFASPPSSEHPEGSLNDRELSPQSDDFDGSASDFTPTPTPPMSTDSQYDMEEVNHAHEITPTPPSQVVSDDNVSVSSNDREAAVAPVAAAPEAAPVAVVAADAVLLAQQPDPNWKNTLSRDFRNRLIGKLLVALDDIEKGDTRNHDAQIDDWIQYAETVEERLFNMATTKDEFYVSFAKLINGTQKRTNERIRIRNEERAARDAEEMRQLEEAIRKNDPDRQEDEDEDGSEEEYVEEEEEEYTDDEEEEDIEEEEETEVETEEEEEEEDDGEYEEDSDYQVDKKKNKKKGMKMDGEPPAKKRVPNHF